MYKGLVCKAAQQQLQSALLTGCLRYDVVLGQASCCTVAALNARCPVFTLYCQEYQVKLEMPVCALLVSRHTLASICLPVVLEVVACSAPVVLLTR